MRVTGSKSPRNLLLCVLSGTVFLTFLAVLPASGQTTQSENPEKGFIWYEGLQGSSNSLGIITTIDSRTGYQFNRHCSLEAGIPYYFYHAAAGTSGSALQSGNGIGNAYLTANLMANGAGLNYISGLKASAPTGNTDKGLSTGRVLVDWNNHIAQTVGRWTVFADLGIANGISDTHFFTRPFTSLGGVFHAEGGTDIGIFHGISLGTSYYGDMPFGTQKVYSRVKPRGSAKAAQAPGKGKGASKRVFDTESVVIGTADLDRDNGFNAWINFSPTARVFFEAGYSHSVTYALDTLSFGAGFHLGHVQR